MRSARVFAVLMLAVLASFSAAHAQDATPASGSSLLDSLGLPQFVVEVDGDTYHLAADEIPAGRTEDHSAQCRR